MLMAILRNLVKLLASLYFIPMCSLEEFQKSLITCLDLEFQLGPAVSIQEDRNERPELLHLGIEIVHGKFVLLLGAAIEALQLGVRVVPPRGRSGS
jgi:hypothetical protein